MRGAAQRVSVRNLHDRYWWLNLRDQMAYYRDRLLRRELCGASHPRIGSFSCDLPKGHAGPSHQMRRL
jgi:hypothetical protein